MIKNLTHQAIEAALKKDWAQAEKLNLQILAENPEDVASLNRLSLAQTNLNKIKAAQKTLKKVLGLDSSNPIALKNLKKLRTVPKTPVTSRDVSPLSGNVFLKEKGKTQTVVLVKPAETQILNALSVCENLTLEPKKKSVHVKKGKTYLGSLPNLLAFHLQKLLKKGYRYEVYFWRREPKTISIFIKEVFRPKKMEGIPSFI